MGTNDTQLIQGLRGTYAPIYPTIDVAVPELRPRPDAHVVKKVQNALTPEEYEGFLKGQIIFHIFQAQGEGRHDSLVAASWYLDKLMVSS